MSRSRAMRLPRPARPGQARQLQRDLPLVGAVGALGQPDAAHAAAADLAHQTVGTDALAGAATASSASIVGNLGSRRCRTHCACCSMLAQASRDFRSGLAPAPASQGSRSRRIELQRLVQQATQLGEFVRDATAWWILGALAPTSPDDGAAPKPDIAVAGQSLQHGRQQQPRLVPVAPHGALGQVQRLGDLGLGVAAEVAHLDHLRQARLGLRQHVQRFVDAQHVLVFAVGARPAAGCAASALGLAAAPLGLAFAHRVDDHRAHHARGVGEEGAPVLGAQLAAVEELQVRLVHQRGGVEHGVAAAVAQPRVGELAQFGIGRREELVARAGIAVLTWWINCVISVIAVLSEV